MMTRRPIRTRLVLVGLAVYGAVVGMAWLTIGMQRQAAIDAFGTATSNLATGMAQQTAQSLASVDVALKEIQSRAAVHYAAASTLMRQAATLALLTDELKRLPSVQSLLLVDADGAVAASTGSPDNIAYGAAYSHFSTADDPGLFVGDPAMDAASGEWSGLVARRVSDSQGRFIGLVVAKISYGALQKFYQVSMPAHRTVYLTRSDGTILVRFPARDGDIGRKVPTQSPWYAAVAHGGGIFHAADFFDPVNVIAVVRPLRNLPFVVEAFVTEADTLADWRNQRLWVIAGSAWALGFAMLLLRLFAGQYRRIELSEQSLAAKNAELAFAHGQLDATLSNLSQGVCFYDENLRLVLCNRAYGKIYGLPENAIQPGMTLTQVSELRVAAGSFAALSVSEYMAGIDAQVRAGTGDTRIDKLVDGRTISLHSQPLPGRGWLVTIEDITARCEAEARVAFLARHDVLTGLANRSLFQERLQHAVLLAERGPGFALLCLDLDGFKAVNDTFGHPIGDSLLRAVTGRLLAVMRQSDTVARLGGDEFAILQLNVTATEDVTRVARRLVQSVSEPFVLDGHHVSVGTSVGIAMAPADGLQPERLMKAADLALYRAKQEGRGTWRYYEPAMDAVARTRRALEIDLRNAVPMRQLELYYQPIVWSGDRSLTGFEALLRWHHPVHGILRPNEFLSAAEETGLIGEIGAWVLQHACAEAMTWPDHLRVSVNLSARQFRAQNLVKVVASALEAARLPPERLELEITELVPLKENNKTMSTLHELHALGARIALDDFGTGFSSLSYLRGFPFDTVKIDKSFVADLQTHEDSVLLMRGMVGLATKLRMNVTAEGVETEDQYDILVEAGCTEIQGYLISKPVAANEVPGLIERLSGREPYVEARSVLTLFPVAAKH